MPVVSVCGVQANLDQLIVHARDGKEVVIADAFKPLARLVPYENPDEAQAPRTPGSAKMRVKDSFLEPLPDSELKHWGS